MAQKDKKTPATEPEKKCNCGPECTCGCNEGKECHCGENGGCGCHCGKRCGGKWVTLLIIFLAGVGFNELLHGCCARCPTKAPHQAMTQAPKHHGAMPMFSDGSGTVIIINASDGHADIFDGMHAPQHFNKHKKHHKNMQKQPDKSEMHKPHFSGKAGIRPFAAQPKLTNDDEEKNND